MAALGLVLALGALGRALSASSYLVDVPTAVCEEPFAANVLIPLTDLPGRGDQAHIFTVYRTGNQQLSFTMSVLDSSLKQVTTAEVKLDGQSIPATEVTVTATSTTATITTATATLPVASPTENASVVSSTDTTSSTSTSTLTAEANETSTSTSTSTAEANETSTSTSTSTMVADVMEDQEYVRLLRRRPGRSLSGKGGSYRGGSYGGSPRRRAISYSDPRRRAISYSDPRRRSYSYSDPRRRAISYSDPRRRAISYSDPRRRASYSYSAPRRRAVLDPRRRSYDSRRRGIAPVHQGWQNPAHPRGGYYNYQPPYQHHHRTSYGYSGYHVRPAGSNLPIAIAGIGGLGVGYAMGHHFGHSNHIYRASRWNTINGGRGLDHCQYQSWQGSCSDCVKTYSMEKCQASYQLPKAANRDDLMTTAFKPADYKGPLRLVISKVTGPEVAKERICPPDGWHWNASLNTFTGTWSPPDTQDVFITLTPVALETVPVNPSTPKTDRNGPFGPNFGGGTDWRGPGAAILAVVLLCCCCCYCCCSGDDESKRRRRSSSYGDQRIEMQGFAAPVANAYTPPAAVAMPMAAPVAAAVPAMAMAAAAPAYAMPAAAPVAPAYAMPAAAPFQAAQIPPVAKTCPQMHPMGPAIAQPGMECDNCERPLQPGSQGLRCDLCDHDLCAACAQQTTFLESPSPSGHMWKMLLSSAAPQLDLSGLLSGPWGDALRAAVVYERQNPHWSREPRFANNGPVGQVIEFLHERGFGAFAATAEHTEQYLQQNPHMLPYR